MRGGIPRSSPRSYYSYNRNHKETSNHSGGGIGVVPIVPVIIPVGGHLGTESSDKDNNNSSATSNGASMFILIATLLYCCCCCCCILRSGSHNNFNNNGTNDNFHSRHNNR